MESLFSTSTLIFANFLLALLNGVFVLFHSVRSGQRSGLYLSAALFLISMGAAGFLISPGLPLLLADLIPNLLIVSGFAFYEFGFSKIFSARVRLRIPLTLVAIATVSLTLSTLVWNIFVLRVIITNSIILILVTRVALLCLAEARLYAVSSIRTFGYMGLVVAFAPVLRIIYVIGDPRVTTSYQQNVINSFTYLVLIFVYFLIVGGYFEFHHLVLSKRREEEQEREQQLMENQRFLNRILSHDLSGPMGSLNSLLKDVRSQVQDRRLPDSSLMSVLVEVSDSSNALLHNVSDLGKYQLRRALPKARDALLVPVLWGAVEYAETQADPRQIEIVQEVEDNLIGYFDSNGLLAVLRNLLGMFVQNSPDNRYVILQAGVNRYNPSNIIIRVKNQGDGMSEEQLDELNRQGSGAAAIHSKKENEEQISLMLILTICRELNWDIVFMNNPQGGFQVELQLPLSPNMGDAPLADSSLQEGKENREL